mmetsp:Transcript_97363/g.208903  ORF Transcript_97363/g.208903 Transcript_97363/m.208903 type:complete len:236 (+) Transcript_97363:663-1370(+)
MRRPQARELPSRRYGRPLGASRTLSPERPLSGTPPMSSARRGHQRSQSSRRRYQLAATTRSLPTRRMCPRAPQQARTRRRAVCCPCGPRAWSWRASRRTAARMASQAPVVMVVKRMTPMLSPGARTLPRPPLRRVSPKRSYHRWVRQSMPGAHASVATSTQRAVARTARTAPSAISPTTSASRAVRRSARARRLGLPGRRLPGTRVTSRPRRTLRTATSTSRPQPWPCPCSRACP